MTHGGFLSTSNDATLQAHLSVTNEQLAAQGENRPPPDRL